MHLNSVQFNFYFSNVQKISDGKQLKRPYAVGTAKIYKDQRSLKIPKKGHQESTATTKGMKK